MITLYGKLDQLATKKGPWGNEYEVRPDLLQFLKDRGLIQQHVRLSAPQVDVNEWAIVTYDLKRVVIYFNDADHETATEFALRFL